MNIGSFGIGSDSSTVDFGSRGDLDVVSSLGIDVPGNYTDEEGYAQFHGWPGQDFDHTTITQRTYVNRYSMNERGHTGRWLVIDYELDSSQDLTAPIYVIQMMDVDLGSSDDDSFSWVPGSNMTVIHQGSTYIGLALFHFGSSSYFGHNAGQMGPSVFESEDKIYSHMSSPNNQTTSGTAQNWYMDIVARVPGPEVSRGVHVSFAILVGRSIGELEEALFDAKAGLTGYIQAPSSDGWRRYFGEMTFYFLGSHYGPCAPYSVTSTHRYSTSMTGEFSPWTSDGSFMGFFTLEGKLVVRFENYRSGRHQFNITNMNQWGFEDAPAVWEWRIDVSGPITHLTRDLSAPKGMLKVDASPDDGEYSGVDKVLMSLNGGPFEELTSISTDQQAKDLSVRAYATDIAGNKGPETVLENLVNDGVPPNIDELVLEPGDVDEDLEGPLRLRMTASDQVSGIDPTSARFRYGLNGISTQWTQLTYASGRFEGSIDMDWEASQGMELYIESEIRDASGNTGSRLLTDLIDPVNDPPRYSINILSPPWQSVSMNIEMIGSDPDGDEVSFKFQWSISPTGPWQDLPSSDIRKLDPSRYQVTIPSLTYEGPFFIKGEAFDGSATSQISKMETRVDKRPPAISFMGSAPREWNNGQVSLSVEAEDSGSGVAETHFIIRKGTGERRVDGTSTVIFEEGQFRATVHSTDVSGNMAVMDLGMFGIDMSPPVLQGMVIEPQDPSVGDDVMLELTFYDALSGPRDLTSVDLSDHLELALLVEGRSVRPSLVSILAGTRDRVSARFLRPFGTGDGRFALKVVGTDKAANKLEWVSEPKNISGPSGPNVLGLVHPGTVQIGEDFVVTSNWSGPIHLEVRYPMTSMSWIVQQSRKEGVTRSFSLPAPYTQGSIAFRAHYGAEGEEVPNATYPPDGWLEIAIAGFQDSDSDLYCDRWEDRYGRDKHTADPSSADRDDDGLEDISELYNLTDPGKGDTDRDRIPDLFEASRGTLPFEDDANEDPDRDGWSNYQEFKGGTDPRDPLDHPDEVPNTPWYWIVLIFAVLMAVLCYFIVQMFRRKRLREDLERFDEEASWEDLK